MNDHRNPSARRFVIHDGEDLLRLQDLDEAVDRAKKETANTTRTLADGDPVAEAVEARNTFLEEANERARVVVLREVGRKKRREMLEECPARDGIAADESIGANVDLLGEALLNNCIASPSFASAEERDDFIESLGGKWFDRLTTEAFAMNFGGVEAPKALSLPSPLSDET